MSKMFATLTEGAGAVLAAERPALERLARSLVWDDEEARDVVQAALVDAVARWGTLRDEGAAAAWLRRIVVHRAMSHLRRRRLWSAAATLFFVEPEPADPPDDSAGRREHLARLGAALDELPARQAAAFSLRYLEGLSIDEVADALGIGRGTVRGHLQRAVSTLRARGLISEGGEP